MTRSFSLFIGALFAASLYGQTLGEDVQKPALITSVVDEAKLITLSGNTRPEAVSANDKGEVPDGLPMEHMLLQLRRSVAQESALSKYIDELHAPGSANFHKWLSGEQFGQRYGLSRQDIDSITAWLQSHGFTVNAVYPNFTLIDFSGTAGDVSRAFHTNIHYLNVNGEQHIANMSDPQIPEALAPAIAGITSLNDFKPHRMSKMKTPNYTATGGVYAVTPGDLATIYDLGRLFQEGVTGRGQRIAVVEDTNLYSAEDWVVFRSIFGLTKYKAGSLLTVHPSLGGGSGNCANPGVNGDDIEAIIDAEYASTAAPGAQVVVASCANTTTSFGGLIALANLLNGGFPPTIVSISYGECEALNGAAANATFRNVYQEAVAEGVSVFVAAGDEGAASCDANSQFAVHGIGVSGFASTPYNVAVGGTDFGDTYAGTNSTYWNSGNTSVFASAKSYIPEIPWNDGCASKLISEVFGYPLTYGANGFCNSIYGLTLFDTVVAGSGGPSGCAIGTPVFAGFVSGDCHGYAKPSWQTGVLGNPRDGVRDLPDVSLFASNGIWGHYFVFCYSDPYSGGTPCTSNPNSWGGAGGTSFSSPILAGIQALVNQTTGGRWGNPNYVYYTLAAKEYGNSGNSSCNSTRGNHTASSCTFYDVTLGDMDVPCLGYQCFAGGGQVGVLSTSETSYKPAYPTDTGWDFATGLGSVNAYNLVHNWYSAFQTTSTLLDKPRR